MSKIVFTRPIVYGPDDGKSYYDKGTGTYYCNGVSMHRNVVERARDYLREQMESSKRAADYEPRLKDLYLINVVAFNAVNMLLQDLTEFEANNQKL